MDEAAKNPIICPTILAADVQDYKRQIERVAHFAHRLQIDLTDGHFAASQTVTPEQAWWPVGVKADFHLMYKDPEAATETLLHHNPHMIIIHAEAGGRFGSIIDNCRAKHIKVGIALLPNSPPNSLLPVLNHIDHVLIFSGDLGKFSGHANLDLLKKIDWLKSHKPSLEIGWDGGVNDQNVAQLVSGGVDVLNVGSYIQNAVDPQRAFHRLQRIAAETGTT